MVFMEFVAPNWPHGGAKFYFVGQSVEAILADTQGGTAFGLATFTSHREVKEGEIRAISCGYLEEGIASVRNGCPSFMLDTPR